MFAKELTGKRWFARILNADVACPKCGKVYVLNIHTPKTVWNQRTKRFHCAECGFRATLGILAWQDIAQGHAQTPPDARPGVDEAQVLEGLRKALDEAPGEPGSRFTKPYSEMIKVRGPISNLIEGPPPESLPEPSPSPSLETMPSLWVDNFRRAPADKVNIVVDEPQRK